ncbi:hypothetical protein MIND_00407300 [Mycena indigotica]|uniref:Uncharacterized protein n=1 Tax=Mycena indigotica TaxID=2126181 RepID=A0A8H6T5H6_9AGAR|nr:uncharacterized protein MIND_00407300 [Mycena indigotica]KAF7310332.1 hypothetical protein MIND_00407300 [Mycena indigotica]
MPLDRALTFAKTVSELGGRIGRAASAAPPKDKKTDLESEPTPNADGQTEATNSPPASMLSRFRNDHPIAATATAAGLVVAAPLLAPVALVGGLNVIGFGASGVVGGSLAAGIQSVFYGGAVTSGSAFAIAQSIGAGGAALTAAAPFISAGGAAVGVVGASRLLPQGGAANDTVDTASTRASQSPEAA